jgi:diaminopimelate decarboxylase
MSCTYFRDGELFIEEVSLTQIAEQYGTPCYVYSQTAIENNWHQFKNSFRPIPHRICYAVKANSNIHILKLLANLGSGFDIVSIGELERVLKIGGDPNKIIFSGVGKTKQEIEKAIQYGIYCFDVESESELNRLHSIAKDLDTKINIAFRVNPNIDPKTHAYISTGLKENKFGIDLDDILFLCKKVQRSDHLNLIGLACHIGSQLTELAPFSTAIDALLALYEALKSMDISLPHLNIGGGLGIAYHDESVPTIADYAELVIKKFSNHPIEIIIEPGRSIIGNTGVLLTSIEYIKQTKTKRFAIVDTGMNDLLRPALYQAWQNIIPTQVRAIPKLQYDIVGPVCESSDFLGKNRELAIEAGDYLCIDTVGAYGFSMSSNYNSRPRPAEIMIHKNNISVIRRREFLSDLIDAEL